MENISKIEIRESMYCGVEFYSLYINDKLHRNYTTLRQAKKRIFKMLGKL